MEAASPQLCMQVTSSLTGCRVSSLPSHPCCLYNPEERERVHLISFRNSLRLVSRLSMSLEDLSSGMELFQFRSYHI